MAVKGTAKIDDTIKDFSFMVKLTPDIGFRAAMVKEVSIVKAFYWTFSVFS